MTYILSHNPGCGSSKKGLELLEANGVKPRFAGSKTERPVDVP